MPDWIRTSGLPTVLCTGQPPADLTCFAPEGRRFANSPKQKSQPFWGQLFGMPDWIRTSGLQSRSLTLYPTELRAHMIQFSNPYQGIISTPPPIVKKNFAAKIVKKVDKSA